MNVQSAAAYAFIWLMVVNPAYADARCPQPGDALSGIKLDISGSDGSVIYRSFSNDILIEEKSPELVALGGSVRRMSYAGFVPLSDLYQSGVVTGVISIGAQPMPSIPIPNGHFEFSGRMSNTVPSGTLVNFWTDSNEDQAVTIAGCTIDTQLVHFVGREFQQQGSDTQTAATYGTAFISKKLKIPVKFLYYTAEDRKDVSDTFEFKSISAVGK